MDRNGDGKINFEEFTAAAMNKDIALQKDYLD